MYVYMGMGQTHLCHHLFVETQNNIHEATMIGGAFFHTQWESSIDFRGGKKNAQLGIPENIPYIGHDQWPILSLGLSLLSGAHLMVNW